MEFVVSRCSDDYHGRSRDRRSAGHLEYRRDHKWYDGLGYADRDSAGTGVDLRDSRECVYTVKWNAAVYGHRNL